MRRGRVDGGGGFSYTAAPPGPRRVAPAVSPMTAALLPLAALLAGPADAGGAAPPVVAQAFEAFTLPDQFGAPHAVGGRPGAVLVVIYGDRKAAEASRELGEELHVRFHPAAAGEDAKVAAEAPARPIPGFPNATVPVRVVPAACAAGVPRPVRSAVAFQLRRAVPETPVWLDWERQFEGRFGVSAGVPNAVVVAPNGVAVRLDATGGEAADRLEAAVAGLRRRIAAVSANR